MKKVIGLTTVFTASMAILLVGVLNQAITASMEEPPFWFHFVTLGAVFFCASAMTSGALWLTWEAQIAKRRQMLGKQPLSGLERSVATMRRNEIQRLALAAYGLDPRQQQD